MSSSTRRQMKPHAHDNPLDILSQILAERDRRTSDPERCPQYNEDNECGARPSAHTELQRSRVGFFLPYRAVLEACHARIAGTGGLLGGAAPGDLFNAQDFNASSGCYEGGVKGVDSGSPCFQAASTFRTKCLAVTPGGNSSFQQREESSATAPTTTGDYFPVRSQEKPNRGRRKEPYSDDFVEPPLEPLERTLGHTLVLQPTTQLPANRNAVLHDPGLCFGHEKLSMPVSSQLSIPCRACFSPSRSLQRGAVVRIADLSSLLVGYALTITIVNAQHTDDSWLIDLPLMELLPPSFLNPSQVVMFLQLMSWSLIGIFHLLRSPRYWPECGLVAIVVSLATGGWFGLGAMVDSLLITGFISLLIAKAIEWVSENRDAPMGGILPVSKQDSKH